LSLEVAKAKRISPGRAGKGRGRGGGGTEHLADRPLFLRRDVYFTGEGEG